MTLEEACNRVCEKICKEYDIDIGNGELSDIFQAIWEEIVSDIAVDSIEETAMNKLEEWAQI